MSTNDFELTSEESGSSTGQKNNTIWYKDKIREVTAKGNLKIPTDEVWGYWQVLNSGDYFERLFLDIDQAEKITNETVANHYEEIKRYLERWRERESAGISFAQSHDGYLLADFDKKLSEANDELRGRASREKYLVEYSGQKKNEALKSLNLVIKAVLADKVLTYEEKMMVYQEGVKLGLNITETHRYLKEAMSREGRIRDESSAGETLNSSGQSTITADKKGDGRLTAEDLLESGMIEEYLKKGGEISGEAWVEFYEKIKKRFSVDSISELKKIAQGIITLQQITNVNRNDSAKSKPGAETVSDSGKVFFRGRKILDNVFKEETLRIKLESYFLSDYLYMNERGKLLSDVPMIEGQANEYTLPLRREFFECFSGSEEIISKLNPVFRDKGNDIEFEIKIPVEYDGQNRYILLSKIYGDNNGSDTTGRGILIDKNFNPALAVWPNFYDRRWGRYFIYNDQAKDYGFIPFNYDYPEIQSESSNINSENVVQEFSRFPDVIFMTYLDKESGSKKDAGAILLRRITPQNGSHWSVAVDFGTSKTNIWYKEGNSNPKQLTINALPVYITKIPKDAEVLAGFKYFIPPDIIDIPLSNFLRIYEEGKTSLLLRDFAIQLSISTSANFDKSMIVKTDIKSESEMLYLESFIEHITVLIAAEAVHNGASSLDLAVLNSPGLINNRSKTHEKIWENRIKKLNQYCSLNISLSGFRDSKYTEGAATGLYFYKRNNFIRPQESLVCFNIGKSSCDLSLWHNESLIYQTVMWIGSEEIYNCFRKSQLLTHEVFGSLETRLDDPFEIINRFVSSRNVFEEDRNFSLNLNVFLSKFRSDLSKQIPHLVNKPQSNLFRFVLIVFLATLVFYAVIVIRKLRKDGKLPFTIDKLNFCWGGSESFLIDWIEAVDSFNTEFMDKITTSIFQGYNILNINHLLSSDPGDEVAIGLLELQSSDADNNYYIDEDVLSGENFIGADGVSYDYLTLFDNNSGLNIGFQEKKTLNILKVGKIPSNHNGTGLIQGEKLSEFVTALNKIMEHYGHNPFNLDQVFMNDLTERINNRIHLKNKHYESQFNKINLRFESLFILEAKELIKNLIDKFM
ncbi:MAG: hypothetical protein HUU43_15585 [Ignavibacteriaceae bacterium]|nr:hypothetical protein [Ignavibacteriaceae bacterium]